MRKSFIDMPLLLILNSLKQIFQFSVTAVVLGAVSLNEKTSRKPQAFCFQIFTVSCGQSVRAFLAVFEPEDTKIKLTTPQSFQIGLLCWLGRCGKKFKQNRFDVPIQKWVKGDEFGHGDPLIFQFPLNRTDKNM